MEQKGGIGHYTLEAWSRLPMGLTPIVSKEKCCLLDPGGSEILKRNPKEVSLHV